MSNFFHPMTEQVSRKDRRCTYCGQQINKGERYSRQQGVHEGEWQDNQFHPECWADFVASDDDEFWPFQQERPATPLQITEEPRNG